MARISNGIEGGISGKIGPIVIVNCKGEQFVRSLNSKRKGPDSPAQLAQQQRLKVACRFLNRMKLLLNEGFTQLNQRKSAYNLAKSYSMKNALMGIYPDITISYPNVLISQGNMPNVMNPSATMAADGQLLFSWEDNTGMGAAKATDWVLLAAYCPELNQSIYTAGNATRSALTSNLNLFEFIGKQVHAYIGLVSVNRKNVASSLYLGEFGVRD